MLPEILQQHLVLPQVGLHARVIHNPSQRASKYQTIKTRQHSLNLFSELFDKLVHRSEEHTSELQSRLHLVCRLLLEKKKKKSTQTSTNLMNQTKQSTKTTMCRKHGST